MLRVARHEGSEFAFGRKGETLALLLPADATVMDAIARFKAALTFAELAELFAYADAPAWVA